MEMMKQINTNYIYLLHEREHIRLSEDVYKVGMTRQSNLNRFNNYPKGSILLFQIECTDCKFVESIVLQVFKNKFYNCFFYGNEYFKGDKKSMIDIIHLIITYESQIRERTTDRRKFIEDILKERENMTIKIRDNQDRTGLFNIKIKLYEIFRKVISAKGYENLLFRRVCNDVMEYLTFDDYMEINRPFNALEDDSSATKINIVFNK
jgi:hypothetical protein